MNFLGMGPMELMLILVLAMIIFGPGKLPEIAGQVGKVVRDFRRTTSELSSEFNRTLSLEIEERKATQAPAPPAEPAETFQAPAAVGAAVGAAPAVEPNEAPPEPVSVVSSGNPEPATAPPASVAPGNDGSGTGPATDGASRRRSYDADLAPPY